MAATKEKATDPAIKRRFYRWHRIIGLTALVPVIFWTLSGLSHPFMANWFRPFITKEVFKPLTQNGMKPVLSVQQVMDQNQIAELRNFSLVNFDKGTFYQVQNTDSTYSYYSAANGKILANGDRDYAIYLARYFTQDQKSRVANAAIQKSFDGKYQPINHLLPVWKISFDRSDGMDIYVETQQSRMGTFNNHLRKTFLWIFDQFHTWRFLEMIGGEKFRIVVLLCIVTVMFLSLLSGLIVYGLYWKKFKDVQRKRKAAGTDDKRFLNRYHRQVGIIVSIVMFTFVTSGAFHLAVKMHNLTPAKADYQQIIKRTELVLSNLETGVPDSVIMRTSLVRFRDHVYYQVLTTNKKMIYISASDGIELAGGDEAYASSLANFYRGKDQHSDSVRTVSQFNNDYGFINKRLPVQQVSYPGKENWYIETSSAKLAEKVEGIDRTEGLSFIFLHKFLWMTWAGKDIRDIVSMLAAACVLIVSLLGFASFIKNK